jgi:hypothetical protein
MKLFISMLILFFVSTHALMAQKIQVTESSETIDNVARSGLYTVIDLDSKQVEKAWERHLKAFGKISSFKGYFMLPSANLYDVSPKPVSVYSKIQSLPEGTKVWWAIDLGDGYASNASNHSAYAAAERELHAFAADCYRYDINEQIKEAEKAYAASMRNHEKEVKHGEQLTRNVAHNQEEKVRLETLLRQNAEELDQLKKDIAQNKVAQSEAIGQTEKMKQAIEVVKDKLNRVQ